MGEICSARDWVECVHGHASGSQQGV